MAEPDGFLSDLIAVLHPTGADYSPAGLHYLRNVRTQSVSTVTAAQCANASAPRVVHAATCDALATANPGISLGAYTDQVKSSRAKWTSSEV